MLHGAQKGFTLVEVLVVVGIIAVLGAIGFSVSGPARESSRQTVCAAQMQQLHKAVMMYSADCDAAEEVPGLGPLACEAVKRENLRPYMPDSKINYCPDLPALYQQKVARSYTWVPIPDRWLQEDAAPGEWAAQAKQAKEIQDKGSSFPLFICYIHDCVFYMPSEQHIDIRVAQPFVIEVSVAGSVSKGRRPYARANLLEAWAKRL